MLIRQSANWLNSRPIAGPDGREHCPAGMPSTARSVCFIEAGGGGPARAAVSVAGLRGKYASAATEFMSRMTVPAREEATAGGDMRPDTQRGRWLGSPRRAPRGRGFEYPRDGDRDDHATRHILHGEAAEADPAAQ